MCLGKQAVLPLTFACVRLWWQTDSSPKRHLFLLVCLCFPLFLLTFHLYSIISSASPSLVMESILWSVSSIDEQEDPSSSGVSSSYLHTGRQAGMRSVSRALFRVRQCVGIASQNWFHAPDFAAEQHHRRQRAARRLYAEEHFSVPVYPATPEAP